MKTQTFTTTINCGGCVRAVTPILNAAPGIATWHVDTATPDKVLTVTGDATAEQVAAILREAGFEAQPR
ncbi:MAG: heavy-metal-associated domain-containing protein [Hymenobacteraceae bacterium]|nr:heavy-metal-associated domain-containing protein [Hymenobacteraceae bacterium]